MPQPTNSWTRLACRCVTLLLLGGSPPGAGASGPQEAREAVGRDIPHSVPLEARRRAAGTCAGFNLELQSAAGIKRRIGAHAEAERLLAQQRNCQHAPAEVRSATSVGFGESRLRNTRLRP